MDTQKKGVSILPKIGVGVAGLLFAISVLGLVGSILLPMVNSHVSWDEAMIGIIGGGVCSTISFLLLGGMIVWLWMAIRANKS